MYFEFEVFYCTLKWPVGGDQDCVTLPVIFLFCQANKKIDVNSLQAVYLSCKVQWTFAPVPWQHSVLPLKGFCALHFSLQKLCAYGHFGSISKSLGQEGMPSDSKQFIFSSTHLGLSAQTRD